MAVIVVSLLSLLSLWLPRSFQGEVLGLDNEVLSIVPGLVALLQSMALAALGTAMARAARLAHLLGSDVDLLLVINDKALIDVAASESPDESSLFRSQGLLAVPLGWVYFAVRVIERLLSYLLFLGLVWGAVWIAIAELADAATGWRASSMATVLFVGSASFTAVAILRIGQYWLVRAEGLASTWERELPQGAGLPFFRRYSVTAIVIFLTAAAALLLYVVVFGGLVRPVMRVLFWRWRADATALFEEEKEYERVVRESASIGLFLSPRRPSARDRLLHLVFGPLL
jgi:hypothetical protein